MIQKSDIALSRKLPSPTTIEWSERELDRIEQLFEEYHQIHSRKRYAKVESIVL